MFININVHSNYSLLQSTITIDDIIKFAIDNNQKYVSLIDINTMYGTIEFYNKAKKNNLVPIIGLQINYENEKIILIAKNYEGYLNIVKISSFIMIKKKYELKLFLNSIIVIFDTTIPKWFNENRNDFYTVNGKNKVAIRDCFYKEKNDISILKAIFAIKNDELFENININSFENKYMLKENEALTFFSKEALNNLEKLISSIDLEKITDGENNFVKYNNAINSNELIYESCINGLKKKMENIPTTYIERLKYELEIINNKNFNDYFLVVQDYVEFAKREGIFVGPGRGSACGSLVSYSLGITEIDPIENNLYFERFLNPERVGFPDIDIDFMDTRKNEIIEYLIKKYSMNKVAHIITFQRMKSKMAIRDVGRILNIKLEIINLISKLFSSEYDENINLAIEKNKNIKEYSKKFPELFTIASKLINFPRQIGLHAAGMVIVNTELYNIVPIQLNNSGDIFTTQYSMEYLEELGVIKIDLLSLSNLTIINNILQKINKNGTKIDLLKINF
ncbi:MAG: PHP domain-containing protein, partial [Mycoplasmataceae bacterium]|nr:PHP domain-containing protein [Mycoplasmataceae bacterium]